MHIDRFKPAFKNPHFQTLYRSFFKQDFKLNFEIEKFNLSDGDFLECFWSLKTKNPKKIVILLHGLTGSYGSQYIQGMVNSLNKNKITSVIMHYRGTSGKPNIKPRSYHSGETQDLKEYIQHLVKLYPKTQLFAVGYSIGGNILLKYLGETKENSHIAKAISISAPLDLTICANRVQNGFSRFYQYILLKDLNRLLRKKYKKFNMNNHIKLQQKDIKKLDSFWKFDNQYTAPMHGFKDAKEYYKKCSSKQFLKKILTPTLIIHSLDDPFMTPKVLPNKDEISKFIELEIYRYGGHVGFIGGSIFKPKYYLEDRVLNFIKL
jgi:predicted alpha/beta-fold hydrolase